MQTQTNVGRDIRIGAVPSCPLCTGIEVVAHQKATDRFHSRQRVYQLLRCESCSLVWLDSPPHQEQMSYHYGVAYHRQVVASGERDLHKRWQRPRRRILDMCKGGALLDIGCSSGAFLRAMKDESWTLHGIEISPEEAKTAEANTGARVFVGDLLDAPFAPKTFDVITALHVLEHVYHPQDVVKRLWQWLKPGGIVYLQIPNIYGFEARLFRSYWFGLELPRHLYHFSPGSLRRLFSEAKFEEVLVSTLPDCYVEKSIRYLVDDVLANAGIHRTPLATAEPTSSLGWRIIRKSLRVGVLQPFRQLSSALERGPAIEAIFRKTT